MLFTTTDGSTFSVGIRHCWAAIPRYPDQQVRATEMWLKGTLKNQKPIDLEVRVTCSPEDNFSRRVGRDLARAKFMPLLTEPNWKAQGRWYCVLDLFTREDRRHIYTALLPEHHAKKERKRRQEAKAAQALGQRLAARLEEAIEAAKAPVKKPRKARAKTVK